VTAVPAEASTAVTRGAGKCGGSGWAAVPWPGLRPGCRDVRRRGRRQAPAGPSPPAAGWLRPL